MICRDIKSEISTLCRTGKALIVCSVLSETCHILDDWMSKGFVKRVWAHGEFEGIADGIDQRVNGFRDSFSVGALEF